MKPLDKLEQEMADAIEEASVDYWVNGNQKESEYRLMARAAAKVAVDLAKRTWDGATDWNYPDRVFTEFLKSEGIETEK